MSRARPLTVSAITAALAIASALAVTGPGERADAHGGEDHSAPAKPAASAAADPNVARVPIETQFLLGLRTERARRGALATSLGQIGTVVARPAGELSVVAPTSGRLFPPDGGFLRLGDEVKKGQLLGTFRPSLGGAESAQLGLSRSDAASRVAAAEARLGLAERELSRRRELEGIVAEKDIQAAEAEVEIARAEAARARADVGVLSGGAGAQRLDATIDGTVVSGRVSPGAQVAEGTELWRIVDLATLWVDVRIPEADAARLAGDRAEVTLVTDPAARFEARRLAVASLVDPATRTVQALFEFDNKDRRARVGALVNISMAGSAPVESVVVPGSALLDRGGTPTIVVKTGPETFELRAVAIGPKAVGAIGITAGVAAGERVVVDGAMAVLLAAGG
ncbi:efflux RND transporter periplasmic adaptor subunit [Sorangium sp. So ce1182]|uniref:efflux RND transporter periplasmic adaptor subunit n=1 Tax=Sorangium sp. So ce1182 TaxID=3133334 RepID=UPI003F5D7757